MRKPIIGLTGCYAESNRRLFVRKNYMDAIEAAGGIPLLLPLSNIEDIPQIVGMLDGIVFTGGGDVDPTYYNEPKIPECQEPGLFRDEFEIPLCQFAFASDIPIFGICRGIQLMNVACGGTLWQDLPSQFEVKHQHSQEEECEVLTHTVIAEDGSLLSRILGQKTVEVNSFHHQAVKTTGAGVIITGHSDDGVPEAIEAPGRKGFFLGIQWHPEYLYGIYPIHTKAFRAFVSAAAEYGTSK